MNMLLLSGETGATEFISSIETGLSVNNIWAAIAPIAGIIIGVTLIAVVRRVLNKNLSATKSGRAGKA